MAAKMTLHPFVTDGVERELEVQGKTVEACLREAMRQYPGIEKKIFAKPGQLKGYVEIYVNGKTAYPQELAHPVNDGDVVNVLVFLAGG